MKLRVVKKKLLRKRLLDLGFDEESGKDHVFFYLKYNGKIVISTKYSHGGNEIRQPILSLIGKQLKLNREQFELFLRGELSYEKYVSILKDKGVIE